MTVVALRIAGLTPRTLAVGGAFTAVVFGLAAQQTLGNLIAGIVLLSARPFRVGERVRLQAGGLAGEVEGVVSSLGLLYTTLARGEDRIMVPNSVVLGAAVVPLREPQAVDLRVAPAPRRRSRATCRRCCARRSTCRCAARRTSRSRRSTARGGRARSRRRPSTPRDGARLADEILGAIAQVAGDGASAAAPRRR